MKRLLQLTLCISILLLTTGAMARLRLEVGTVISPTVVFDERFEFFSSDSLMLPGYGLDIRVEVADLRQTLQILPFVAYRIGMQDGFPSLVDGSNMRTNIRVRDVSAGLRLRGWFLPWLGAYGQGFAGVTWIDMEGEIPRGGNTAMKHQYEAQKTKWHLGAGVGAELRISPEWMAQRGIHRFNFGGDVGLGFIRRAQTHFKPTVSGGDEYSIDQIQTVSFGDFDLSGLTFTVGLTFRFF